MMRAPGAGDVYRGGHIVLCQEVCAMDANGESLRGGRSETPSNLMVERKRLVSRILDAAARSRTVFVCAPSGFGKTALLMQCTSAASAAREGGDARLVDVRDMDGESLLEMLDDLSGEVDPESRPLIALDNFPTIASDKVEPVVQRMRVLRDAGATLIVSCEPTARELVRAFGDSEKFNATALLVRPDEYAQWVSALGISSTLDVYGLTQGVPSLVAALRTVSDGGRQAEGLERAIQELYLSIIEGLKAVGDPLFRVATIMTVMGSGTLTELERSGVRFEVEALSRMTRDYPVLSYDVETRAFSCLGSDEGALGVVRGSLASTERALVVRTVQALVREGRLDEAVDRMRRYLDPRDCAPIVADHPMTFVLRGHAAAVRELLERVELDADVEMGPALKLAAWASALCMGDYRAARAASADLCRRADAIAGEVAPSEWETALAFALLWRDCKSIGLPDVSGMRLKCRMPVAAERLRAHVDRMARLASDMGDVEPLSPESPPRGRGIDLSRVYECLDACLIAALRGGSERMAAADAWIDRVSRELMQRKLVRVAATARAVASACRLMGGRPVVDENAFTDASRIAVRESNTDCQLLCMVFEGWQYMASGQAVNAEFRAQQVRKLAGDSHRSLSAWALLLERVASASNCSRMAIRQEAELIDLSCGARIAEEAWATALQLSAAQRDADLAAWFSMHRQLMLGEEARGRARLAMHLMGERAGSMRRLLPRRLEAAYALGEAPDEVAETAYDHEYGDLVREVGQVTINLFGGFHAMRNGHILTEEVWRRRKATFLAARLALARGAFVGRKTLMDELWPDIEYRRARQNLYVTVTALRQALCQQEDGPQYVVAQAGSLAFNEEYVSSDLARFDALARDVLLKRTAVSSRQIVESCLRIEELYKGPLFVPEFGDVSQFVRMRRFYESRFIDCMMRGVDAALEEEDLPSASWLAEAAVKQAPTREDVVRHVMKVMALEGRRREVVELYSSHMYYLQHELNAEPEAETRALYEKIVEGARGRVLI